MAMKMTTDEKLLTITLEELLTIPYGELISQIQEFKPGIAMDVQLHLSKLTEHLAVPYVEKFEVQYAANPGPNVTDVEIEIIRDLAKQHGLVVTGTWSQLSSAGTANIEKAKWAHKRLGALILRVCTEKVD